MKKPIKITLYVLLAFTLLAMVIKVYHYFQLNTSFSRYETVRVRVQEQKEKVRQPARIDTVVSSIGYRGKILDCNGKVLARSSVVYDIRMDPTVCSWRRDWDEKAKYLAADLSALFEDKTPAEYYQYIAHARKSRNRYIKIHEGATYSEKETLKTFPLFEEHSFSGGLIIEEREAREYPYGSIARRAIGSVRRNGANVKGYVGIEGSCDEAISGQNGYMVVKSKWVWNRIKAYAGLKSRIVEWTNCTYGRDVQTTLDISLQTKADSVLRTHILNRPDVAGACLVLADVGTGEIRSMVNLVRDTHNNIGEFYNISIGRPFEPGALIKPALEISSGKLNVGHFKFDEFTVEQEQVFADTLRAIFLGNDWDGETWDIAGLRKPQFLHLIECPERLYTIRDIASGRGMNAPAIHYLGFYNAIARGGEWVRLSMTAYHSEERYRVCSQEEARTLRNAMEKNVSSERAFNGLWRSVAGQKGTSFEVLENGDYINSNGNRCLQSSFAGYFPSHQPEYSVICMVFTRHKREFASVSEIPTEVIAGLVNAIYE